jgi:hypothetical protein
MLKQALIGIAFILFGIGLFYLMIEYSSSQFDKKSLRAEWPTTQGYVLSSDVELQAPSDDNLDIRVQFSYQVNGTMYTRIQQWPVGEALFGTNPPEADAAQQKYSPGKKVTVYYNPDDPTNAVLEPRAADFGWLAYPLGLAFIAGMILPIVGVVMVIKSIFRFFGLGRRHNDVLAVQ